MIKYFVCCLLAANTWGSSVFHFPPGDPRTGLYYRRRGLRQRSTSLLVQRLALHVDFYIRVEILSQN